MKTNEDNHRRSTQTVGRVVELFGWQMLAGLAVIAGLLLFFGWLSDEVFEGETQALDESVRNYVHGFAAPSVTAGMKFFTYLGSPLSLVILGAVAVAVLIYLNRKRAIALFLITMTGELALDLALKPFFGRARPAAFFDFPLPASYGFPSGHALGSLCFFGILAWLAAARTGNRLAKIAVLISAAALVFLIGLSRVYLGVHYPSDILAGFTAGLFWLGIVALTDWRLRERDAGR